MRVVHGDRSSAAPLGLRAAPLRIGIRAAAAHCALPTRRRCVPLSPASASSLSPSVRVCVCAGPGTNRMTATARPAPAPRWATGRRPTSRRRWRRQRAAVRDCGERCDALQREISSALQWSTWCGAAAGGERRVQRERSGAVRNCAKPFGGKNAATGSKQREQEEAQRSHCSTHKHRTATTRKIRYIHICWCCLGSRFLRFSRAWMIIITSKEKQFG